MSDAMQSQQSQLVGYCGELQRLAVTITGMLSQCEALGTPLGDDRSSVERLEPVVTELERTIRVALNADTRMREEHDAEVVEDAPATRTTGARNIDWGNDGEVVSTPTPTPTPQSADPAPLSEPEPEPEPEPTTDITSIEEQVVVFDGDEFPGLDKCADLMMSDLNAECTADEQEKGEITLQGTNESLPLPSVFQFLAQTNKSGTLRVKTAEETMRFEIVAGDMVFSHSSNPPKGQLLGEVLISMDLITRDALEKLIAQAPDHKRLGTLLEEGEFVSHEDLKRALKTQIHNRLTRAFEAPDSAFTFSEGGSDRPHHRIRMSVSQLLLESL